MGTPTVVALSPRAPNRPLLSEVTTVQKLAMCTFTFSTTYATGGEAFDPVTTFPGLVRGAPAAVEVLPKTGWTFTWDSVNKKILAYTTANTEVANAANLSVTPGALTVMVWCP